MPHYLARREHTPGFHPNTAQSIIATTAKSSYNAPMEQDLLSRITIDPAMCGGRRCIRDQRMRVSDVLDLLASGATSAEILQDYSFLEPDDIVAAILYAARQTDHIVLKTA